MRFILISFLVFLMAVLSSCEGEDDSYSGVGKLIAERNKMRHQLAGEPGSNKNNSGVKDASKKGASKAQLSTNVLAEKKIVIVDTASGSPIGKGVAYVDKQGNIVKIKLAH